MPCKETDCKCEAPQAKLIELGLDPFGNCRNPTCGHPVLNHTDASAAGLGLTLNFCADFLRPGLSLDFVLRPEISQIIDLLRGLLVIHETDVRNMYYILVEGLSGVGKTRGLLESIEQWVRELDPSARAKILLSFHKLIKTEYAANEESKNDSIGRGYYLLCQILYKTHFSGQTDLKYPAELHSANWKDGLEYMLKKWASNNERRIWLLQLDDAQFDPVATRSILRASVDWNNPMRAQSGGPSPCLNIMITVACSLTSGVEVRTEDLIRATGLTPKSITMRLGQDALYSLLPQVLKSVGLCLNQPWLTGILQPWMGGWPIAYFFLEEVLRTSQFSGDAPLLLVEAKQVYDALLRKLDRYGADAYITEFGTTPEGVQNLLALAITSVQVLPHVKINCVSITEASKGGLFTLREDGGCLRVEIPFISLALVNQDARYCVCQSDLFQPFASGWEKIEDLASTSLALFINALAISFSKANIQNLRPGALFGPGTADRQVKLARVPWMIRKFHAEQLVSRPGEAKAKFNLKKARIELEGKEEDLSNGAVIRAVKDQSVYDYMAFLPAPMALRLVGQARARDPSNAQGEEPQTQLEVAHITQSPMYNVKFGQAVPVVEFFSTRPLSNGQWIPPANTIVVHQANFATVVGPAFGLLIKLHTFVKETKRALAASEAASQGSSKRR